MVNKVILVGTVGSDPTPIGEQGAKLRLATDEVWKDKNSGETQKRTEWHNITVFGHSAAYVLKYVSTGTKLYIEGKLATREHEGKYYTDIIVDQRGTLQSLSAKPKADSSKDFNDY